VSKRLWALAAYSRFIRPGAVRAAVATGPPDLRTSAFRNTDGTWVIEVINTASRELTADLITAPGRATTYLTDNGHSLHQVDATSRHGQTLATRFAPRSLTTIVINPR
jgi:glucuronoarabinoxylan endo-1,4-beta-xylanase